MPEALASGLAVLSYAVAAAANLISDGRNGALVQPGEEVDFINAAVALAVDSEKRLALRQEAPSSVAHMSWMAVADSFITTLRSVMERHDSQLSAEFRPQPAAVRATQPGTLN